MALTDANKSALAFKNTQGKAHTAGNKELGNEEEQFRFIVGADTVWLSEITETPNLSISEYITASLVLDPTSNGRAFFTYYPLGHEKAGQRVTNVIPHSFGNAYEVVLKGSDNTRITEFDARDWVYQYQPGILFQQTANATPMPVSASLYVYKGATLSSSVANGSINISGGVQWTEGTGSLSTTGSVSMAGPQIVFSGSNVVWNNEISNNYTIDPATTKQLHLVSQYGMTASILDHATMFTLSIPSIGTMVDAEITIFAKDSTLTNHSRFKFSTYAFNTGGSLFSGDALNVTPDVNTVGWNYNVETSGTDLLFHITGSAPYLIDWTMHAKFLVG